MITDDTYKFTRTGDGSESRYTFGFKIFEETDVKVAVINPGGSRFSLVRDTHFTVSGLGVNDGGAIQLLQDPVNRYTDGNSDNLRAGWTIEISREADYDQELSIGNQQELNRQDIETALDKLTVLIQQLRRERVDWEGEWDTETTYHLGALVFYNGSLWHSLKNDNLCRVPGTTAADQPFTGDIASCEPGEGYWENLLERVDISDETLGDLSNVAKAVDSADNGLILKRVAGVWEAAMEVVGGATPEQLRQAIAGFNDPRITRLDQAIRNLSLRGLFDLTDVTRSTPLLSGQVLQRTQDGWINGPGLPTRWSSGVTYTAGTLVYRSGRIYIALRNNSGQDPLSSPADWDEFHITPWSNGRTYGLNQLAMHNGGVWVSLSATNRNNTPAAGSTHWRAIGGSGGGLPVWSATPTYAAGEFVVRHGHIFVSRGTQGVRPNQNKDPADNAGGNNHFWDRTAAATIYHPNLTYYEDEIVSSGNTLFVVDARTVKNVVPAASATEWSAFSAGGTGSGGGLTTWATGTTYARQDVVVYMGKPYVSLGDNNQGRNPSTETVWWRHLGFLWWNNVDTFRAGSVVFYEPGQAFYYTPGGAGGTVPGSTSTYNSGVNRGRLIWERIGGGSGGGVDWTASRTTPHSNDLIPLGTTGTKDTYGDRRHLDVAPITNLPANLAPRNLDNNPYFILASQDISAFALRGDSYRPPATVVPDISLNVPVPILEFVDLFRNEKIPFVLLIDKNTSSSIASGASTHGRVILLVGESVSGNSGGNIGQVDFVRHAPRPGNARAEHNFLVGYTANVGTITIPGRNGGNPITVGGYIFNGTAEYPLFGAANFMGPNTFRFYIQPPQSQGPSGFTKRYSLDVVSLTRQDDDSTSESHTVTFEDFASAVDDKLGFNHHLSQINAKDRDQDRVIQSNREEADTNAAKLAQLVAEIKTGTGVTGLTKFFESLGEAGAGETVSRQIALTTRAFTISGQPVHTVRERQVDLTDGNFPQPLPFVDIDFGTNLTEWVLGLTNRTTRTANLVLNITEDGNRRNLSFSRPSLGQSEPVIYAGSNPASATPVVDNYGIFIRENLILLAANTEATFPNVRMTMTMAATWNIFPYLSNGDEILADAVVFGTASFRLPGGSFDLHIRRGTTEMTLQALTDLRAGDILLKSTPERPNFVPPLAFDSVGSRQGARYLVPPERGFNTTSLAARQNLSTSAVALNAEINSATAYGYVFSGATGHDHAGVGANTWGAAYHFWYLLWARFLDRYIGFKTSRPGVTDPTLLFDFSDESNQKTWVIGPMSAAIRTEVERLYQAAAGANPAAKVGAAAQAIKAQFALHIPQPGLPSMAFTPASGNFDMTLAELVSPTRTETYLRRVAPSGLGSSRPRLIAASGNNYTLQDGESIIAIYLTVGSRVIPIHILVADLTSTARTYIVDSRNAMSSAGDDNNTHAGVMASISGRVVTLSSGTGRASQILQGTISRVYGLAIQGPKGDRGDPGGYLWNETVLSEFAIASSLTDSRSVALSAAWNTFDRIVIYMAPFINTNPTQIAEFNRELADPSVPLDLFQFQALSFDVREALKVARHAAVAGRMANLMFIDPGGNMEYMRVTNQVNRNRYTSLLLNTFSPTGQAQASIGIVAVVGVNH